MDENGVSKSCLLISDGNGDSLYPMYFGVSCAFFALKFLSAPKSGDEKLSEIQLKILQGSAQLLGLLIWRVQKEGQNKEKIETLHKLEISVKEIEELKKRRREDARANEKVVSIFAAQEQCWFNQRKKLQQHIGALLNELRVREKNKEETIEKFSKSFEDFELAAHQKDKVISESAQKNMDLEKKLSKAEKDAQDHVSELRKHKTAFIELVSNQRQLESEMGRALKQFESTKNELESVMAQKEEAVSMVQKLSVEVVRIKKDSEQKEQILSAMLRKSKLDTLEKETLLKEVKMLKAKRKEAELESERWRVVSESKNERSSLKSILSRHVISRSDGSKAARDARSSADETPQRVDLVQYVQPGLRQEAADFSHLSDVKRLENWVRLETDNYANAIEQRHHLELDAFTEQMRQKDEKVEAYRWRLLSMELESKRLQTYIEGLNQDRSHLKQTNMKLETMLYDQETELHSLREQKTNVLELDQTIETTSIVQFQEKEIQEDTHVFGDARVCEASGEVNKAIKKKTISSCKVDLNALGVSFKLKRLKQQLLMLEKFSGKQENCENRGNVAAAADDDGTKKNFVSLMSLLNKQVGRYQTLQEKADDLCFRMHENGINPPPGESSIRKTKAETKALANFLEETFQLQRYIVATGQKMMEIQSKVSSGFVGITQELVESTSFDIKRFSDNVGTLFKDVQRGLEVRIVRIIGDLEGTLACDGIKYFKR